jgi:hypothetical protein
MEVRMENTPPAATDNDPVRCFVAIELSKSSWVLGFQTPLAKQTSRYQVKACDAKALLELIERVRSRNPQANFGNSFATIGNGGWARYALEGTGASQITDFAGNGTN